MWGRLLGLTAILLQVAVFLQPLLPEKQHFSSVCKTVAQALFFDQPSSANLLQRTASTSTSESHLSHTAHSPHTDKVDTRHSAQHAHVSSKQDAHENHECEYCLVYSFALPLLDTKLRYVLIRTQIRVLSFKASFTPSLFQTEPLFVLPQSRAPPFIK
ncbi:DUF2946 family protein [Acinetobacter sp. AL9]|uniref:DUF2946 family protein n=1 Tax=Acinetobacter sp. AL9 TaxID=3273234 RepID=UPI0035583990